MMNKLYISPIQPAGILGTGMACFVLAISECLRFGSRDFDLVFAVSVATVQ